MNRDFETGDEEEGLCLEAIPGHVRVEAVFYGGVTCVDITNEDALEMHTWLTNHLTEQGLLGRE